MTSSVSFVFSFFYVKIKYIYEKRNIGGRNIWEYCSYKKREQQKVGKEFKMKSERNFILFEGAIVMFFSRESHWGQVPIFSVIVIVRVTTRNGSKRRQVPHSKMSMAVTQANRMWTNDRSDAVNQVFLWFCKNHEKGFKKIICTSSFSVSRRRCVTKRTRTRIAASMTLVHSIISAWNRARQTLKMSSSRYWSHIVCLE